MIFGVKALVDAEIKLTIDENEWLKVRSEIPIHVVPKLKLSRPIQLVIAVGSDTRFPLNCNQ